MTAIELLASLATGGAGTVGIKSAFDYLTHRGNRTLTAEKRLWERIDAVEKRQAECDRANDTLVQRVAQLEAQNAGQARELDALRAQNAQQARAIAGAVARADKAEGRARALHSELDALRDEISK